MCNCCTGKITGLGHIGVFVKDIEKSIEFYTDVLCFDCYHRAEVPGDDGVTRVAFVKSGTCDIELVQFPATPEKNDGPVDHIALAVDDIEAVMARLTEKGIAFETESPIHLPMVFDGIRYIFFRGPDGEHLELNQAL